MKKTVHKSFALLLAILLVLGSMPLMSTAAFAAQGSAQAELDDAIAALVDPTNLKYYADEAILRVADALGGGYNDPQTFLQSALENGYRYVGGSDPETMAAHTEALRKLMAKGKDMDAGSLGYLVSNGEQVTAIHRNESKANMSFRIVPILLNDEPVNADEVEVLQGGDTVTFAAELETDYPVSAAVLPIVFDSTKFGVVEYADDTCVYAFDADETENELDILDACPNDLIDTSVLSRDIRKNYITECYTLESAEDTYPVPYRTPEYMNRYKILLAELMPCTGTETVPQIFTPQNSRLFTFSLRVRAGAAINGAHTEVGIPEDWFVTAENAENKFAVTRAAGMTADGSAPATNGSTAKMAYQIFDNFAQYGQTMSSKSASVRFGSGCEHAYTLSETVRPTPDSDGYEVWVCTICGDTRRSAHDYETVGTADGYERRVCTGCGDEIIIETAAPVLELSQHTAGTGREVDVTVSVRNNPGIVALRFALEYDTAALELLEVEDGGLMGVEPVTGIIQNSSPFWLLWTDALTNENHTADGTLVTFRFRVRDEAPHGRTELKLILNEDDALNKDLQEQHFTTHDSFILVVSGRCGDADGNGKLTIADVIVIERYLVARLTADELILQNADVNRDGKVNLKDVVILKRYLAGGWGIVI